MYLPSPIALLHIAMAVIICTCTMTPHLFQHTDFTGDVMNAPSESTITEEHQQIIHYATVMHGRVSIRPDHSIKTCSTYKPIQKHLINRNYCNS